MTFSAFSLILASVFLHAGWNVLSKKCSPSGAFYLLASMTSCLLLSPFFIFSGFDFGALPGKFRFLLIGSGIFEVLYFFGLAHAYRTSNIALAYPLARALPVLMVALVTTIFGIGRELSATVLTGMAIVSAGCLIMPLKHFGDFHFSNYWNRSILFILLAAAGTTGYTILDSESMKLMKAVKQETLLTDSLTFLFMMELMISTGLGLYVSCVKTERQEFKRLFLKTPTPMISGIFSASAYILILSAMGLVSNVSYIQAFRQMSLPLGVFAGIFLLKEKITPPQLFGILLVILGLITVSLG